MGPTVLYVPGFWEGVEPFQQVASLLSAKNIAVATSALRSTGTSSPGNPSMHDDIATIRSSVETLTAEDKETVMVLHSAGGFLGSNAIEGLTAKARTAKGLKGGVVGIVFNGRDISSWIQAPAAALCRIQSMLSLPCTLLASHV